MAARNKPSPFRVDAGQFATVLRTVSISTTQKDRRRAAPPCFNTFDSQWHRFICQATAPKIFH